MLIDDVIARNLVPNRDDLHLLPAFDFTDVCEVVLTVEGEEERQHVGVRQCINSCPPFPEFWMESAKFPIDAHNSEYNIAVSRWGCMVMTINQDGVQAYQMVPFVRYKSGNVTKLPPVFLVALTEHWDGVHAGAYSVEEEKELTGVEAGIADMFVIPILRALTFMACSNADVREVKHSTGSQMKRAKHGKPPLVGYSRIMVPGGSRYESEAGNGHGKAFHRVRGHFCRRRREDWGKPGAVWWRQSHVRGDAQLGARIGRYTVAK